MKETDSLNEKIVLLLEERKQALSFRLGILQSYTVHTNIERRQRQIETGGGGH